MADVEILKWQEGKNLQWMSRDEIFDAIQRIDNAVFHENGLATKESDIARYEAYRKQEEYVSLKTIAEVAKLFIQ